MDFAKTIEQSFRPKKSLHTRIEARNKILWSQEQTTALGFFDGYRCSILQLSESEPA